MVGMHTNHFLLSQMRAQGNFFGLPPIFIQFDSKWEIGKVVWMTSTGLKKILKYYHIIKFYFVGTIRITSVLESKRDDRATPQSLFIAPNVSPRWFFGFHTPYEQFSLKMLQKEDVSEEQVDLWVDVKNFLEAFQCYSLFLQTCWWS